MPKAQIPVVILHGFAPEADALGLGQAERRRIEIGGVVLVLAMLEIVEPRLEALGTQPIGSAVDFHLEDAQVNPKLDSASTVVAGHDPDHDRFGIELPLVQDLRQIIGHSTIVRSGGGGGRGRCLFLVINRVTRRLQQEPHGALGGGALSQMLMVYAFFVPTWSAVNEPDQTANPGGGGSEELQGLCPLGSRPNGTGCASSRFASQWCAGKRRGPPMWFPALPM